MRATGTKLDGARGIVWVDRAKTSEELRPSRMCSAAQRWLQRELQDSDDATEVMAYQQLKNVQVKDRAGVWWPLGAPGRQDWVWFTKASEYLSEPQMDVGASFIARR